MKRVAPWLGLAVVCFMLFVPGCYRPDIRTVEIPVPGLTSEEDAQRIHSVLAVYESLGIVHEIAFDLPQRRGRVTYDSTLAAVKNLEFLIAHAGYDAGSTRARRFPAGASAPASSPGPHPLGGESDARHDPDPQIPLPEYPNRS